MADRFDSFAALEAGTRRGADWDLRAVDRESDVAVIAPHGGTIEPATAEIAEAIAGEDLSFYAFEALRAGAHGDYHITSHRFDEPEALALVGRARSTVALHGRKDDGTETVWLGGRDTALRDAVGEALRGAGFAAEVMGDLPGVHETNICNRTRTGGGVQLELPIVLRRALLDDPQRMAAFAGAVRRAIAAGGESVGGE